MTGLSIPIFVQEHAGLRRVIEPVRIGVPFPRGFLEDAAGLKLKNSDGVALALQCSPLDYWSDRSIKWALLDFFAAVEANSQAAFALVNDPDQTGPKPESSTSISISETAPAFIVDTGAAVFTLARKRLGPLDSVSIGGVEILAASGSQINLIDDKKSQLTAEIDSLVLEETGLLRCTFKLDGKFVRARNKVFCNFRARLIFFAGLSAVALEFQIHNPRAAIHPGGLWDLGDPGSVFLSDLSLALNPAHTPQSIEWLAETNGTVKAGPGSDWLLYQDSSGGENWNSQNHVNRDNRIALSFQGYKVFQKTADREEVIAEGRRAAPYVKMKTSSGWMAATVLDFWQNFPKALRAKSGTLSVAMFPAENAFGFELQAGEKKRHTLLLDFGQGERSTLISQFQNPLHAVIDPQWVEKSGAISYFVPRKDDPNAKYLSYIGNVVEGPQSFFNKREVIDEYGWRNFGDIYSDHEAVNHQGTERFISHYNNQYDFIYGSAVHFLRSGDSRWFELMRDAARHTIDIDIYHTGEDKAAYNHGLFWHTDHYRDAGTCTHRSYTRKTLEKFPSSNYGGGPCNEHDYSSGLLYYFYLTGDSEARDAVLELAQWVISMDDGSQTVLGLIDDGPTGYASNTGACYHGPGRGAGNSINTLIDAYRLTGSRNYFIKAEELLLRCIHPKDDIAGRRLDDPELRWSYLVFLQVLGKYLDFKADLGETDYYFHYARESLLHYAGWMLENEVPYKDVLHKVDVPTETWPAHDVRKCHVLHLAARYSQPSGRRKYSEKAGFFFDRCLEDLLDFKTAHLTRPLVILTVYGFVHSYFQSRGYSADFSGHAYNFGHPEEFVPQRARLKTGLFNRAQVGYRLAAGTFMREFYSIRNRIEELLKRT
ncbi:MAG: hypothetical protein ACLQVJ_16570 [Syntrophobacteraceae bacterium]